MKKLWRKILFKYAPAKLLKIYTSKAAHRMYFLREYELAYRQIWRAEFFREQKKELREEIRREYDKINETQHAIQARLDQENKKDPVDGTLVENLIKQKAQKAQDISQFKEQIDHIDQEIKGYTEALESLRVTLPLVEKYIKK